MKLPRDVSGQDLSTLLRRLGYEIERQTGSHLRLSRQGGHHVTIPSHSELKVGTLSGIIGDVAEHLRMTREEVMRALWG